MKVTKAVIVATFLAVLEMAKANRIKLMQHKLYGNIRLINRITKEEIPEKTHE